MQQYYVLTQNPRFPAIFEFIQRHALEHQIHVNRTRFWVPAGPVFTEFALRFADHCGVVDASLDLITGQ